MANDHSPSPHLSRFLPSVGILAAIASALPCFFSKEESLRSAIAGAGETSNGFDRLSATGFAIGGLQGADWARAVCSAIPVLLLFLVVSRLAKKLPHRIQLPVCAISLIAGLALIGFGTFGTIRAWKSDITDLRLMAPVELLKTLKGENGRIYFNSPALSASRLLTPELTRLAPDSDTSKILASSLVKWREDDRRSPFHAVLLSTPLEDSRPLVEMLLITPGWHLACVDNQGLLFTRGSLIPTPEKPVFINTRDTALFDAQKAMVMHFLGEEKSARDLMSAARASTPNDPRVLVQCATLAAAFKQWPTVRKDAESALEGDPYSIQARYLRALALFETGNITTAAEEISSLCSTHPDEPSVLWLAARIARESNDPTSEIAALEKLLALAKKQLEEPTVIHIHLAQAWAKRGFATQALQNYNAALSGNLTQTQRNELESARSTIQSRAPQIKKPIPKPTP